MRILTPMRTRTIPPKISAFCLRAPPSFLPMMPPIRQQTKVTAPIKVTDRIRLTRMRARLIPTARASILVAIDCSSKVFTVSILPV